MTDVFISYKREERESARRVADALNAHGFAVWWDAEILPGEQYRAVTLQILQSCRAAIVIWSPKSILSSWVLDEATRAMERGVLIPLKLEEIPNYPLGFGQLHTHDCTSWDGDPNHAAFAGVVAAVRRLAGAPVEAARLPASGAEVEAEVAFWRGVQDSRDAADVEAYLGRYERGLFADLARRRLETLKAETLTRAPRKRASTAPRKRKAAESKQALESPSRAEQERIEPSAAQNPAPLALRPPFTVWEIAFVAAVVLIAAFAAWPIANRAHGNVERAFYPAYESYLGDIALLFSLSTPQNVFVMTPLLTALAWGYDRATAWWTARERWPNAPSIAAAVALVLFFFLSLAMRDNEGRETHFALWLASAWIAAITARPATTWLRARLSDVVRAMSRPPQPPSA
ncbi:MAG: toll/interleukin-1 receptor domain-containing protein [Caulobacteraceae bacterium]